MKRTPKYEIVNASSEERLTIRDIGPWDEFPTITSGVEDVVEELFVKGHLKPGRRLFYFDSEGDLDEILIKEGKFLDFRSARGD